MQDTTNNTNKKAPNLSSGGLKPLELNISIAESRKALEWKNIKVSWAQLRDKLSIPVVTSETADEFASMPRDVQSDIKDVGGWVGGVVQGGRRIRGSVPYRQVLALDLDSTTLQAPEMWYKLSSVWSFKFLIHTTRSYTNLTPRYRCVIPLSRMVDNIEYEAVGRYLASLHDINQFDPTTYQSTRLMYFPSMSRDGFFFVKESQGSVLDVNWVLSRYLDYTDNTQWSYGYNDSPHAYTEVQTAQDPLQKGGVVGAFCNAYPIRELLEVQLGAYYKPESNGRYTYIGGSSSGGVVVYEDKWCYSHHSTDPNREKLLNAFDLYRLVMFGAMDFGVHARTNVDNLPSYKAMVEWCNKDARVQRFLVPDEARDIALFSDEGKPDTKGATTVPDWLVELMTELDKNPKSGKIECTQNNYAVILDKDPNIIRNIKYDTFTDKVEVHGSLPWERKQSNAKLWTDSDDASARIYIDKVYSIKPNKGFYIDAFLHVINKNANRVDRGLEFVSRGTWDGVPRAEKLFINTLGVEDTELNRAQSLIWLKALVARQFHPGIKFDNMLVLSGPEGIGKSSIFKALVGEEFFTDSFSFGWQSNKMYEAIEGKLIVESAELDGFDKKEAEAVKAFLSSSVDRRRKAYDRITSDVPRRCVFAGSTNQVEVLRSQTGNRRMWIMMCHKEAIITPVWELMTPEYVEQIWAEVREKYKQDKRLYLPSELLQAQRQQQQEFTQEDPLAGEILQYVKIWLPEHWDSMSVADRRLYISGIKQGDAPRYTPHHRRETVSAVEFMREWMGVAIDNKSIYLSKQINTVMRSLEGFELQNQVRYPIYGRLRSFSISEEVNGSSFVGSSRVEERPFEL